MGRIGEPEQFRFDVPFQIVLATVTGLRFVMFDRADILDKEKRKMLPSLLLNSKLDQAIVLATSEEAPPFDRATRGEVSEPRSGGKKLSETELSTAAYGGAAFLSSKLGQMQDGTGRKSWSCKPSNYWRLCIRERPGASRAAARTTRWTSVFEAVPKEPLPDLRGG